MYQEKLRDREDKCIHAKCFAKTAQVRKLILIYSLVELLYFYCKTVFVFHIHMLGYKSRPLTITSPNIYQIETIQK